MTYQLKNVENGAVFTTSRAPVWEHGIWECGDQRFTDPDKAQYTAVVGPALLTPMQFYLAFTPIERVAIKTSTDPVIKEFWDTYQLLASKDIPIDPALSSVTSGLAYLKQLGILASDARVTAISQGQPA